MIQITRVEHLLHCVVPAATVRMQVEAAEIAALETALELITQAGFVVHTPRWQRGPSLIQDAKQILTQMIDSKRRGLGRFNRRSQSSAGRAELDNQMPKAKYETRGR